MLALPILAFVQEKCVVEPGATIDLQAGHYPSAYGLGSAILAATGRGVLHGLRRPALRGTDDAETQGESNAKHHSSFCAIPRDRCFFRVVRLRSDRGRYAQECRLRCEGDTEDQ